MFVLPYQTWHPTPLFSLGRIGRPSRQYPYIKHTGHATSGAQGEFVSLQILERLLNYAYNYTQGKSRALGETTNAGGERVRETVASRELSCNGNGSGYMSESEK